MGALQAGIQARQAELHEAAEIIAQTARRRTNRANVLKIATVLLGALTAAKGTFDIFAGPDNHVSSAVFAAIGVAISMCAGIEATFKFDKIGAELTILASSGHAAVRWLDTEWRNRIGSNHDTDQRDAARQLMRSADEKLAKLQEDAAKLGVNITVQVYGLDGDHYRKAVGA